ncbi:hypothetical protein [Desulfosporosinus sp. FKB]|uniref:hypothetical protein n=1 Tax=Desulfosporosinus sp. FKB TaxID=1969835 RepID=UPI000B4A3207|nr:hypothetical protein [Desulfosporosinus sp. FKB]
MTLIYRSKKCLTRIALIPLAFILFLAVNVTVSSGTSSNSVDHEGITSSQSIVLNHTFLTDTYGWEKIKDTYSRDNIKGIGSGGRVDILFSLPLLCLIWKNKSKLLWRRNYTLVSLCVRMDE